MLKVYIEENAFTAPQPVEVSADAAIARLLPALVQELNLPETDLFGNPLVYTLRNSHSGQILPDSSSLRAAGIQPEARLALDSYVADQVSVRAAQAQQPAAQHPSFYADQTIADPNAFAGSRGSAPLILTTPQPPPTGIQPGAAPRRERRWARRALLLAGGAALGVAGVSLGYAAYRRLSGVVSLAGHAGTHTPVTGQPGTTPAAQTLLPTRASSLLAFMQHQ